MRSPLLRAVVPAENNPHQTKSHIAGTAAAEPLHLFPRDFGVNTDAVEAVAKRLAENVVERDKRGGSAQLERQVIRDSGLLRLSIPAEFGGQSAAWPSIYRIVRRLAEVDSSLAHLFAFHHLQVATVLLYGSAAQLQKLLTSTVANNWFWGNATNGLDTRVALKPRGEGYVLDGIKSFCSGAVGADMLTVTAPRADNPADRVAFTIPTTRVGVTVHGDWDAIGQRQTDSGNVSFDNVAVESDEILGPPGLNGSPRASLRTCISQLILTEIFLGNAQGALHAAWHYTHEQAQPWFSSGVRRAIDDPYVLQQYGDLWLEFRAATGLADDAAQRLQQAWNRGEALTAQERGGVAVAVAQAKLSAARAALHITAQIFEVMGARATASKYGFDRFWRNVRTHTLHDSLAYKLREVGQWVLTGAVPPPSIYS